MSEIKLYIHFWIVAVREFFKNFSLYKNSFFILIFLGFLSSIPWRVLGLGEGSLPEILIALIVAILSLVVMVNVILIEKSLILNRPRERLLYAAPTFLIYTIYASLIIVAGPFIVFAFTQSIIVAIIPAFFCGLAVAMVPVASVCIDNDNVNYFKLSWRMFLKKTTLVACVAIVSILTELVVFLLDFISSWQLKLMSSIVYSFIDAFLIVVLTIVMIKVFYQLKIAIKDPS